MLASPPCDPRLSCIFKPYQLLPSDDETSAVSTCIKPRLAGVVLLLPCTSPVTCSGNRAYILLGLATLCDRLKLIWPASNAKVRVCGCTVGPIGPVCPVGPVMPVGPV